MYTTKSRRLPVAFLLLYHRFGDVESICTRVKPQDKFQNHEKIRPALFSGITPSASTIKIVFYGKRQ